MTLLEDIEPGYREEQELELTRGAEELLRSTAVQAFFQHKSLELYQKFVDQDYVNTAEMHAALIHQKHLQELKYYLESLKARRDNLMARKEREDYDG